jgi:galactose-1-phosphate uridylyltransferase
MTEAIELRKELNSVGNNLNQAVKKLHTLQQIAEFRPWIQAFKNDYERMTADVADIKKLIAKISDSWLQ